MSMIGYRELTRPQRRALDRFARSTEMRDPVSRWPEIGSASLDALLRLALLERAGTDSGGEPLYRPTDAGTRVHDEMWRDGKVPHHPEAVEEPEGPPADTRRPRRRP
jgi:hypothetical protein